MAALEQKLEMRGDTPTGAQPQGSEQLPASPQSIQISVDEDMQKTLVDIVMDDYHHAKSDKEEPEYGITSKGETLHFTEWFKRIKDLYNGDRIPKTIPWKFCSNRSLRIAAAILDLLHARIFPAVWNEDLTRWRAGNIGDAPKSDRISKFMSWWIRVWAPLKEFYDRWTKYVAGFGDALTETSWDVEEIVTSVMQEIPIMDEQNQPLMQNGEPSVVKQPKINRIEKTKSRFITKDNYFFMKGARDVQRDPFLIKETLLFKELEDLEKKDGAINVTTELEEKIQIPEPAGNIDPEEKERLRRIKLRNHPVDVLRWYGHYDVDGIGANESLRIMVAEEYKIYLGGVRMRDITKSGRRPVKFTKYDSYINRPEDLDGEGVLHKVKELAEEVDAIFNQMTDANTLSVLRPFFYDPSGDLDAPAINLGPNKGIPVTDPQKNVYMPPFETRTENLINAIRLVMEFIERLTAASEYVMGRESNIVGGSGTATRTQAIVQSAEIRFTLPSERLRVGAADILNDHLDIIQLNIPPGFEQKVVGEGGEQIFHAGELTDEGISGEFQAYLLPDPSMGSKQTERDMMNFIYAELLQNPIVASDPQKLYAITFDQLKALGRDEAYITRWLGPPPNPDSIDDPDVENTLMIQGDFDKVNPQIQENHMYHIKKHLDLQKSPNFQQLAQTAPELFMAIQQFNQLHIQQHMEMMMAMMSMLHKGGQGGGGQPGQNGTQGGGAGEPQGNAQIAGMGAGSSPMGEAQATQRNGQVGATKGA